MEQKGEENKINFLVEKFLMVLDFYDSGDKSPRCKGEQTNRNGIKFLTIDCDLWLFGG